MTEKEELAYDLYAKYDYCMTGLTLKQIEAWPLKEIKQRIKWEEDGLT